MKDDNLRQMEISGLVGDGRLDLLIRLVREISCQRLVDVGSDHATVPVQLRKLDHCGSVLVTDLREGPLAVAVSRAEKEGISVGFDTAITNGLVGLDLSPQDILMISGLGGRTIARILEESEESAKVPKRMILQPQTHHELLRQTLFERGFAVTDERCVRDRGRTYLVIVCDRDDNPLPSLSPLEAYFGPVILRRVRQMTAKTGWSDVLADHAVHSASDGMNECHAMIEYVLNKRRRLEKQAPYKSRANNLLQEFKHLTGS